MSNTLRKLKIAFSVCSGIVCLALIVMWVRSYWWQDFYRWRVTDHRYLLIGSGRGWVLFDFDSFKRGFEGLEHEVSSSTNYVKEWQPEYSPEPGWSLRFANHSWRTWISITAAYWSLVLIAGIFSVAPWIHWSTRFSLRTLLIATTLVAAVLGLAVFVSR